MSIHTKAMASLQPGSKLAGSMIDTDDMEDFSNIFDDDEEQLGAHASSALGGMAPSQPNKLEPFVNLILIVDPISNKLVVPKQVLSYKNGDKVASAVLEEQVVENLSSHTLSLLSDQRGQQRSMPFQQRVLSAESSTKPEQKIEPESVYNLESTAKSTSPTNFLFPLSIESTSSPSIIMRNHQSSNCDRLVFGAPHSPVEHASSLVSSTTIEEKAVCSDVTLANLSEVGMNSKIPVGHPPLRALSAYNFFFRDERDRVLHGGVQEWTTEKQQRMLADHWSRDRKQKRRHRKTHGKIDFTGLSRLISQRWKDLPDSRKDFYREIAARDWERYQLETVHFKSQKGQAVPS